MQRTRIEGNNTKRVGDKSVVAYAPPAGSVGVGDVRSVQNTQRRAESSGRR